MTKVLYISHNLQNTGWGRAARENILALDAAGVDVVWRPIHLNGDSYKPEGRYAELAEKDIDDADYCIQHVLPQFLSYDGRFKKNISYFVAETLDWNYSGFHHNINLMDELWVPNQDIAENAKKFIKIPIRVVPHPYSANKTEPKSLEIEEINSAYNFYTIGEWNKRKRFAAIIQAFNLEFKKTEPVNLVIKTNKAGANPVQLGQEIKDFCNDIKVATKLYSNPNLYPSELIISSFMTEDELTSLHYDCQCYINASYGEAWSFPVFDAMVTGNAILSSDVGGPADFLTGYEWGFPLQGNYKFVFGMNKENFPNYNSSREKWFDVDIDNMRFWMRQCYENNIGKQKYSVKGQQIASKYSRESVGNLMKGLL
jgi:glycosyltransferase involved in cell wall biosynthesis